MGYKIYGTCVKLFRYSPSSSFLLSSPTLAVLIAPMVSAVSTILSLVIITNVEVFETNTSFLILFLGFEHTYWSNNLFFAVEVFNLADVFLFIFDDIGVSTCCKGVMATTLFLPCTTPKTFLVVLVFFASLGLVGGRLLGILTTRYVNKRSINGLISSKVFLFLFCRPVSSRILWVNLTDFWRWL